MALHSQFERSRIFAWNFFKRSFLKNCPDLNCSGGFFTVGIYNLLRDRHHSSIQIEGVESEDWGKILFLDEEESVGVFPKDFFISYVNLESHRFPKSICDS
jgi:hypothetical protein